MTEDIKENTEEDVNNTDEIILPPKDILPTSSYPHIPTGKPVVKPEPVETIVEEAPEPPPTLEDLIPTQVYPINSEAVAKLFDRPNRPASIGESNRKTLTFTITLQTDQEWRDFLETYTGTQPRRGVGISSPMVELAMQVLMSIIADFKLDEVATALKEIAPSPTSKVNLRTNLHSLANQI